MSINNKKTGPFLDGGANYDKGPNYDIRMHAEKKKWLSMHFLGVYTPFRARENLVYEPSKVFGKKLQ